MEFKKADFYPEPKKLWLNKGRHLLQTDIDCGNIFLISFMMS